MADRRTCYICNKQFASYQRLQTHINSKRCKSSSITPNLVEKININIKPTHFIGIDINNGFYYAEIMRDENISIKLNMKMSMNDLLVLFNKIHKLDDPEYGPPIHSILSVNNLPGLCDVYNYYDQVELYPKILLIEILSRLFMIN